MDIHLFIEIFKYACMPATNGENCLVKKIGGGGNILCSNGMSSAMSSFNGEYGGCFMTRIDRLEPGKVSFLIFMLQLIVP